jgi:hypothetical protein
MNFVNYLPLGTNREHLRNTVARVFGEIDPEAALAWATSQQTNSGDALVSVLLGVLSVDPERAQNFVVAGLARSPFSVPTSIRAHLSSFLEIVAKTRPPAEMENLLDRLITRSGSLGAPNLETTIIGWSESAPESAFRWSLRNRAHLADSVFLDIGRSLASSDPLLAQQAVYQLDDRIRGPWVRGVTQAIADDDLPSARAWTLSLERGELRDAALSAYLYSEARNGLVDTGLFLHFEDGAQRNWAA